jgi:hypothetical protein
MTMPVVAAAPVMEPVAESQTLTVDEPATTLTDEEKSGWLITSKVAEFLATSSGGASVEEYLDARGDVIRLRLRLDEEEFRRLTAGEGASLLEWSGDDD